MTTKSFILIFLITASHLMTCFAQGDSASSNDDEAVFISEGQWRDSNNWKNHQLPNSQSSVKIQADVILDYSIGIKTLQVDEDASIRITANSSLSVAKTIENKGSVHGKGELVLNGNSAQFLKGEGSYNNLRIDKSSAVIIDDIIELYGNLYIDGGNLVTKGNLFLKCDFVSNTTAQIAQVHGQISGEVITEQCYPARRANRLISASVSTPASIRANWQEGAESYRDSNIPSGYGTHITGINPGARPAYLSQDGENGFDYNPSGNASMFVYDNLEGEFNPIDNTNTNRLSAGNPYMVLVRGDRSINIYSNSATPTPTRLRAKGEVVSGDFSTSNLSKEKNGFSLIGNPYHAQVDMKSVLAKSKNLRKDVYYVWDPKLGGVQDLDQQGGRGAFVVVELPSGKNAMNSDANQYLQPMQAAFVQTIEEDAYTEINFSEEDKVSATPQTEIFSESKEQFLNIQLYNDISFNSGHTPSDALRINFDSSYNKSVTDDIAKLQNIDENFSRVVDGKLVALERRGLPDAEEVLPLFINQYRRENYVFNFEFSNVLATEVYLIDHYLGTETLISGATSTYSFNVDSSVSASVDESRFSLKLSPVSLSLMDLQWSDVKIYPNPAKDKFSINGLENFTDVKVDIFNMMGQNIYSRQLGSVSKLEINDFNAEAEAGIYIVKISSKDSEMSLKLIKA